jgi:hypothetical protein
VLSFLNILVTLLSYLRYAYLNVKYGLEEVVDAIAFDIVMALETYSSPDHVQYKQYSGVE